MPDVRFGLEENPEPIYNNDEINLFENTTMVRRLVEQMETKEVEQMETKEVEEKDETQ